MLGFFETIFVLAAPLQDLIVRGITALSHAVTATFGDSALARLVSDALLVALAACSPSSPRSRCCSCSSPRWSRSATSPVRRS